MYPQAAETMPVIIDTPMGSRNKYKFDEETGIFKIDRILPDEMKFPVNFGYLPTTLGEDGDPLDVIVLMAEPVFVGCMVEANLVGAIEAEVTEKGQTFRNDRLVAVWPKTPEYANVETLNQLSPQILDELENFFVTYEEKSGKGFKVLGRYGRFRATQLVAAGLEQRKKARKKS